MFVPLLCAVFHLCHIVGCQGQALEAMTSSDGPRGDETLKRESIESLLRTSGTLDGIIDVFSCWVGPPRVVIGGTGVLLVEDGFVLFKALHLGVVDVLGKGDESRRRGRRSVGSRHFVWRCCRTR